MGTHRPEGLVRPFVRQAGAVGVVGALPCPAATISRHPIFHATKAARQHQVSVY